MCVCEVQAKDGPLPPWISRPSAWGRRLLLRPCPLPSPADRRRRCPGPCPCRQLGGRPCPVPDVGCLACVRGGLGLSHSRSRCCWLTAAEVTSAAGVGGRVLLLAPVGVQCRARCWWMVDVVAVSSGGGTLTVDVRAPQSSIKIVQPGRSEKGTWTWKVVRWAALACGGARA